MNIVLCILASWTLDAGGRVFHLPSYASRFLETEDKSCPARVRGALSLSRSRIAMCDSEATEAALEMPLTSAAEGYASPQLEACM